MSMTRDAIDRTIAGYPGGREAMRVRIDPEKSPNVWQKEIAGNSAHKLDVDHAVDAAAKACAVGSPHCYDFVTHVAQECGGKFVADEAQPVRTHNPLEKISLLVRETGDVTGAVIEAMGDGVITDNELDVIEAEIAQAEEALRKLRRAARAVNAAGKPAHARAVVELPVRETTGAGA